MKKIYTFALCLAAMMVNAQNLIVSPTGMMDEIGMEAEGMSPNAAYVAGLNQLTSEPAIWNVAAEEVSVFSYRGVIYDYQEVYGEKDGWEYIYDYSVSFWEPVDSVWGKVTDYDNVIGIDTIADVDDYTGTFHAINNAGLAVGEFGSGYGSKYPAFAHLGDTAVTYLYADRDAEDGGGAYAVNADGSVILGFYFDAAWVTHACLWLNGGQTAADRVDLPWPTEEQLGFPIDYVAARWMSEDASTILGYAQDEYNGKWVAVYWTKNLDGTYMPHAELGNQYFTPYGYDQNYNSFWVREGKPYCEVEPNAISADGNWISLTLKPTYDLSDWNALELQLAARYEVSTHTLNILDLGEEDAPIFFGIANNGTAVGAKENNNFGPGPMPFSVVDDESTRVGYVWPSDRSNQIFSLRDLYPNEEYFNYEPANGEAAISGINAEGTKMVGYTNKTDGVDSWAVSSFIVDLPAQWPAAVENIEMAEKAQKVFENNQIIIIRDGLRYTVTGIRID